MQELNRFDTISRGYDSLARLVFGRAIIDSQRHFLGKIPAQARVLILGGGTGELLPELFRGSAEAEVWYIEASAEMIHRARSRLQPTEQITFIHGTHNEIPDSDPFDVVITNFFLDLFSDGELDSLITSVSGNLKPGGTWLVSDFISDKRWHRAMLAVMYRFFYVAAGVKTRKLPRWREALVKRGFSLRDESAFFRGFIRSAYFCKAGQS